MAHKDQPDGKGDFCYPGAMHAHARLRLPDGQVRLLFAGDVIGRGASVALRLSDPRISEAHAMLSLRGDSLRLLALRGRFTVGDDTSGDVELRRGQVLHLARDLTVDVLDVALPDAVLGLEGDGLIRQALAAVASLRVGPPTELLPRFQPDADAAIWSEGDEWTLRLSGEEDRPLIAGDSFVVGGATFRAVMIPLGLAAQAGTSPLGAITAPLHLVVRYDTAHIHRTTEPALILDGLLARILSELASIAVPVSWESLARQLWPQEDDVVALRRKWDTNLTRLRRRLREAHIRTDLVRADGHGNFEIFLEPGDQVVDQT